MLFTSVAALFGPIFAVLGHIIWTNYPDLPDLSIGYVYPLGLFLGVPFSRYISDSQWIKINTDTVEFHYTRFSDLFSGLLFVPWKLRLIRHYQHSYDDIAQFTLVEGFIVRDGRPRPLFEYHLKSGDYFWVPLSAFAIKDIRAILLKLAEHDVPIKITGGTRFATGAWMGSKKFNVKRKPKS